MQAISLCLLLKTTPVQSNTTQVYLIQLVTCPDDFTKVYATCYHAASVKMHQIIEEL